ncbi:hypothetical protein BVX98_04130 [bacterium F11]|nr:hypothetical protein BVX98_04130 [bacterium F11]
MPNFISQMIWRFSLDVFSRGTFLVLTICIARVLSIQEFGIYNYATSLAMMFYVFTDLGLNLQLVKELGANRNKKKDLWFNYWQLKMILMVLVFFLFIPISFALWKGRIPWVLIFALLWMLGNASLDFNQVVCNGLGRMDMARHLMLVHRGCVVTIVGLTLIFFPSLKMVLVALGVASFLGGIGAFVRLFQISGMRLSFSMPVKEWKRILRVSFPNAIGGIFGTWYIRMGAILILWFWNARVVGEYSAAFRIFEMTYLIPWAIMSIGVPHLSEVFYNKNHKFESDFKRILALMGSLGLMWSLFIFLFSPWIIQLLFGERFVNSIVVLRLFSLAGFMVFINYFFTHLMVVINHQKRHALHEVVAFVLGLLLFLVLIPRYGSNGAAIGLFLIELILFGLTSIFLVNHWKKHRIEKVYASIEPL